MVEAISQLLHSQRLQVNAALYTSLSTMAVGAWAGLEHASPREDVSSTTHVFGYLTQCTKLMEYFRVFTRLDYLKHSKNGVHCAFSHVLEYAIVFRLLCHHPVYLYWRERRPSGGPPGSPEVLHRAGPGSPAPLGADRGLRRRGQRRVRGAGAGRETAARALAREVRKTRGHFQRFRGKRSLLGRRCGSTIGSTSVGSTVQCGGGGGTSSAL